MTEDKDIAPKALDEPEPRGRRTTPLPPELEPSLAALRQEMSRTIAAQETKGRGWAKRVADSLTPGHQERQAANHTFAAYSDAPSVRTLDTAIDHFRKASPRRQRESRALAFRFFLGALNLCKHDSMRQEDVDRVLRTGNDARELWSDGTNPGVYLIIVYCLAEKHYDLYAESLGVNAGAGSDGPKLEAFELAEKYFLEVIDNGHAGYLGTLSRMQLGFLFMIRCVHEHTTAGLEMCIKHWECALQESNTPQEDWYSEITLVADSASDDLIAADRDMKRAGITHQLGVAYQLQYQEDLDHDSRLQNLNTSIDYFEEAQVLFMEIKDSELWLAKVMYSLATRLVLRWEVTREQSDIDRAKELLKTVQTVESIDDKLKRRIKSKLTEIECQIDDHYIEPAYVQTANL